MKGLSMMILSATSLTSPFFKASRKPSTVVMMSRSSLLLCPGFGLINKFKDVSKFSEAVRRNSDASCAVS